MTYTNKRKMNSFATKSIFIFFLASILSSTMSAESLIEKAFIKMPDEYYLSLSSEMRRNMVNDYKKDSAATQKNRFKGQSSILKIDSLHSFISIQNSKNGKVDMKLLRKNDSIIYIAVVFTACAPVCDSHVGFFAANWQLLNFPLMPSVSIKDFLDMDKIKSEGKDPDAIAQRFDVTFMQSAFVKNEDNIEVSLNSEKFADKDNFEKIKPYLKGNKLLYTWKNGTFEKTSCYNK
ncbi:MAG: DUF3256 family protein [Paludibacteraceae bacterium]|nr:DUF3256 family protein [Paludibacteraceae bacterium]